MQIELREGRVRITGYVNAVGRDSRPIPSPRGSFIEQVEPGVFRRALEKAEPIGLMLNHERPLGSTADGALSLREDSIGLYAQAEIADRSVIEAARKGELRGWSFGFTGAQDAWQEGDPPRRLLTGLDLKEVSLIDSRKIPAYTATSVEVREEGEALTEYRSLLDPAEADRAPGRDYERMRQILRLKKEG